MEGILIGENLADHISERKKRTKIKIEVKDCVPYLPSKYGRTTRAVGVPFSWTSAAGNGKLSLVPRRTS